MINALLKFLSRDTLSSRVYSVKGIGGGSRVKIPNFSCFDICYSLEYLVSKMGSLASQLAMAHEI